MTSRWISLVPSPMIIRGGVSVEALHGQLLYVADASVDAHGIHRHLVAYLAGVELGHSGFQVHSLALVLLLSGLVSQQPGGLYLGGHIRQLQLYRLVLSDGDSESLPLLGVADGVLEGGRWQRPPPWRLC